MKDETLASMGKLLDKDMPRDAVHIACAPVIAGEDLMPGDHIGFISPGTSEVGRGAVPIGIVDPYLRERRIAKGARFWLFLYPGSITSLKHLWTHPAFADQDAPPAIEASKQWLTDFASHFDISYGKVVELGNEWLDSLERGEEPEYYVCRGFDTPDEAHSQADEFWHHLEVVTGRKRPADEDGTRPAFFTCSC